MGETSNKFNNFTGIFMVFIMAQNNRFRGQNSFLRLEEAVNYIKENDDADTYDILVMPPDPASVSDVDEGNEEDLLCTNMPNDVPGTIEVVLTQQNNNSTSDWSDSDDEPLLSGRRKENQSNLENPKWRREVPTYSTTYDANNAVSSRVDNFVKNMNGHSPCALFEKIFDTNIIDLIVENSTLYANQNNRHNFSLDSKDLKRFFGILLLSGYMQLPSERAYWSLDEDLGVSLVPRTMSRNRFLEIKQNLHFADNSLANNSTDKMFKLRPICNLIERNSCQWGILHENLSIDESMIKYFGRHSAKQFIMGKPVRFGYKNWAATSSDGYCYVFDVYCGKSTHVSTDPLGSRVVKSLLAKMPIVPKDHMVYFDNFFTNYNLLRELKQLGYRATGTIRDNRTKKCPLVPVKEMKRQPRAQYDYRFDRNNEIAIVRWNDNNVVTMATNFDFIDPLGKVKRWCKTRKQKVDFNIPRMFLHYNNNMGGVDQMDQSISLYRVSIRGKKWWWPIFTYLLDLAVSNAWRLHVTLCKAENITPMDQLSFRRSIARSYLQPTASKRRQTSSTIIGPDCKNNGHNPERLVNQLRCVICHSKCRWRCALCTKTLCVEKKCFGQFHT